MFNFRENFTKWYYKKGYRIEYKPLQLSGGASVAELIFKCPFWVRPLASWFFSPCVYYREAGYTI